MPKDNYDGAYSPVLQLSDANSDKVIAEYLQKFIIGFSRNFREPLCGVGDVL